MGFVGIYFPHHFSTTSCRIMSALRSVKTTRYVRRGQGIQQQVRSKERSPRQSIDLLVSASEKDGRYPMNESSLPKERSDPPFPKQRLRASNIVLKTKQNRASLPRSSTKHNRLPIHRPPIRRNPLPPKLPLHNQPPRLIEPNPLPLHNNIDLPLRRLIQSTPSILTLNIRREIKI